MVTQGKSGTDATLITTLSLNYFTPRTDLKYEHSFIKLKWTYQDFYQYFCRSSNCLKKCNMLWPYSGADSDPVLNFFILLKAGGIVCQGRLGEGVLSFFGELSFGYVNKNKSGFFRRYRPHRNPLVSNLCIKRAEWSLPWEDLYMKIQENIQILKLILLESFFSL